MNTNLLLSFDTRELRRRSPFAFAVALVFALTATRAQAQAVRPAPSETAVPPTSEPTVATPPSASATASEQSTAPVAATAAAGPTTAPTTLPAAEPGAAVAAGASPEDAVANSPRPSDEVLAADLDLATREVLDEVSTEPPKLNVYGFADFTYARRLDDRSTNFVGNRLPSFYVGNFNVYLSGDLGKRWRALSEVRFTYLPDGVTNYTAGTTEFSRTSTAYPDYADYYRSRKVGGVMIERVWVEYAAHSLLNIRAGQWLTPYGIWNVDHGSPVVIGVTRPYIVGNEWLPSRQTGLELYGTHGINEMSFGYHLTLSNGRGPVDSYEDLDKNKAVGWRFWGKYDSPVGAFTLGTSGYRGTYTDRSTRINTASFQLENPVSSSYEELGLAADFKWTWGGYLLQSEVIVHDVAYDDRYRPTGFGVTPGWTPDDRQWGFYAITGYRLPWFGLMPFVGNQYLYVGSKNPLTCWELNGGLNVRPTDRIVLKAVGLWVWRPEPMTFSKSEGQFLAQIAWSF